MFDIIKLEKTLRYIPGSKEIKDSKDDWFSHDKLIGTGHETSLYESIDRHFSNQQTKIEGLSVKEFYLLRNEQDFKILDSEGRAFAPDFVLFLVLANSKLKICQVFIEPKGENIEDGDFWKEHCLVTLDFHHDNAFVCGLEFYNPEKDNKEYYEVIKTKVEEKI